MNATTASDCSDPFIDILKLKFPSDIRKNLQDNELIQIYETFEFPKLQTTEIETISERISKGHSYNESMKGFTYLFPFRPSSLQVIEQKCPQDGSKLAQFAVYFTLQSYNAFCLLLERNKSISYLPILLNSLISIREITPLSIRAFIRCISYYSFVRDFYQLKSFLPYFNDFFRNTNLKNFDAFEVFGDLFTSLTKNGTVNISEEATELYTLLSTVAEQNPDYFTEKASVKILNSIKFLIIDMDNNALDLAAHISPTVGSSYVSDLCKIIVPKFIDQITSENPSLSIQFPDNQAIKLEKPEQIMQPIYSFHEVETFPNDFNVVSLDRLPEREEIISLCKPENVKSKMLLFLRIVQHHEQSAATFLETFQDSISISVKNPHFFDLLANFLCAALNLSEKVKIPHMVRFLFSDILFDPRMICTIEDTKTYKLNSLRSAAFELILNEGPSALESVLTESIPYPQLYSEFIYRCIIYRSLVGSLLLQSTKLLHIVVTSSLYYQKYCFMGKIDVDSVRVAIFLFLSFLFNQGEIESYIFSDSYFISSFLSFIFEEKVRPFILTQLKAYLTKDNQKVVPLLGEKLMEIFNIIQTDFPKIQAVNRLNDIFTTIIDSLSIQHRLAEMFRPVINPIMNSLPLLVNTKECQDFVLNSLQFFAVIAHDFTLSNKQLNLIESTILTVFENNPSQSVFNGLIQIMNGDIIYSTSPTFIIRHPLVLPALLRIFINTSRCTEVIKYIYDLCSYTTTNAISCHTSGLDRLLLEYLHSLSFDKNNKNEIDEKTIDLILELFSKIAYLISSPDVVSLYLSLLSPIADKGLPKYFQKVLLSLNSIVSSSLKSPVSSIPFPKEQNIIDKKIDITEGFTFVAWIQIDSIESQFKPNLFIMKNNSSNSNDMTAFVRVSLSSNVINIYQRNTKSESSARADKLLPLNQWSFVSITYKVIDNGKAQWIVSINGHDSRPLPFPIFNSDEPNDPNQRCIFTFFGVADDSVDPDVPVLIGPFAVLPLLDAGTITQLFGHGPRQLHRMTIHPFCTYIPQIMTKPLTAIVKPSNASENQNINEDNEIKNEANQDEIKNEIVTDTESESEVEIVNEIEEEKSDLLINNSASTTFLNVLINHCKVTVLIPLLSLIDFKDDFGNAYRSIADVTIELISNSLLMSNETEIEFARLHGFEIISELLMQTSFSNLNYSNYLRFFSLLQMLRTTELQTQLIRTIVGNIELWIVSDAENQLRILKHWARVLYLTNSPTDDFSTFLSNTVLYYWNEDSGRDYLKGLPNSSRPRPSGLNTERCRNYMIDILLIMSQRKFTLDDFDLLMSYIKESPDEGTVLSLANLILMMAKTVPSPLSVAIGVGDGDKVNEKPRGSSLKTLFSTSQQRQSLTEQNSENESGFIENSSFPDVPFFSSKSSIFSATSRFEAVKEKTEKFLALLHQLFKRKMPELTKILIETICMLHVNKILTNPSFDIHIEIIIHRLPQSLISQELFDYLYTKLLPSIPQILPLCFWLAFNISDVATAQLVSNTNPSNKYAISDRWCLWPIIIATQVINSVKASILVFLAKCGHEEWLNVYSTIIIVCNALGEDYSSMLSIFLIYLSNCLLCQMIPAKPEILECFFDLARHFLLFRDSREKQQELENAFKFSPFSSSIEVQIPIKPKPSKKTLKNSPRAKSLIPSETGEIIKSMKEGDPCKRKFVKAKTYTKKITQFAQLPYSYGFGLRLDERLRWRDLSLAQNTMHLIGMTCYWQAFDIDLIICSFVLRTMPSIVQTHLNSLKFSSKVIEQYQLYIDLLCFKAMSHKVDCSLIKYKSKHFLANASNALFETSKWKMEKFVEVPFSIHHSIKEFYKEFLIVNPFIDIDVENEFNCYISRIKKSYSNKVNEILLNKKVWNQLWDAITAPGSIWEEAVSRNESFYRDNIGCFYHCPFKTKRILNYKQSKDSFISPEFSANCILIVNTDEYECEFSLFDNRLEIVKNDNNKKVIFYSDITEILPRSRFHKKNSIEIFMKTRKSYFISFFDGQKNLELINDDLFPFNESIIKKIKKFEPRLSKPVSNIDEICADWVNRKISNFEYIIELNKLSGRSFNDLTQYPIFPWIIKDYSCQMINLNETSLYRDLRRPIGTMNDVRIKKLRELSEERKSIQNIQSTGTKLPYLYKTGPSSEKIVKDFISKILHNSNDIHSDFKSVSDSFKIVTSEAEDFRELLPEFFFQPEVFKDIDLPPWSSNPIEFVYLNRKALESDYVSASLDSWIDLIWGYQNRGREAVNHENNFMPDLYDSNDTEVDEKLLRESGIIPSQLFSSKHPQRIQSNAFKKQQNSEVLSIESQSDMIVFAHFEEIEDKITSTFIDESGILKKDTFSFGKNNEGRINSIEKIDSSNQEIKDFDFVSETTKFSFVSNKFILVSENNESTPRPLQSTILLNTKSLSVQTLLSEQSICIASSYPYIVTLGNEFVIKVFKINNGSKSLRPFFIIPHYRVSSSCIEISNLFHIIAVGCIEEILIYSISKTTLTKRIFIDEGLNPKIIKISPSWGFIVVYATFENKTVFNKKQEEISNKSNSGSIEVNNDDEVMKITRYSSSSLLFENSASPKEKVGCLVTFSVNGDLIRKRFLQFKIVAMTTWKSPNGFDFVAFATDKDKIYVCEAFFLEVGKGKILKCNSPIKEVFYSENLQMLVAVTKDGNFYFKPYSTNDFMLYGTYRIPKA